MDGGLLKMGEKGNVRVEFRLRKVEYEEEDGVNGDLEGVVVVVAAAIVECK